MQILSAFAHCKYCRHLYCPGLTIVTFCLWISLTALLTSSQQLRTILLTLFSASRRPVISHHFYMICTGSQFRVASNSRFPYFAIKLFMALPQSMSKLESPYQPGRSVFSAHASFLCSAWLWCSSLSHVHLYHYYSLSLVRCIELAFMCSNVLYNSYYYYLCMCTLTCFVCSYCSWHEIDVLYLSGVTDKNSNFRLCIHVRNFHEL